MVQQTGMRKSVAETMPISSIGIGASINKTCIHPEIPTPFKFFINKNNNFSSTQEVSEVADVAEINSMASFQFKVHLQNNLKFTVNAKYFLTMLNLPDKHRENKQHFSNNLPT